MKRRFDKTYCNAFTRYKLIEFHRLFVFTLGLNIKGMSG